MLQRISSVYDTHKIVLTKPLYKAEAYLLLYPEGFSHLMDVVVKHSDFFGDDFLAKFEAAWAKIHSQQGRQGLYELLSRAMSVEVEGGAEGGTEAASGSGYEGRSGSGSGGGNAMRKSLVEDSRGETRAAVAVLSVYSAFLMSFFEGQHRKAFELLYAAESIHEEAKAFAKIAEESQWAADDVNPAP